MKNPLLAEVRRNREAIAAECGHDLGRIAAHAKARALELGFSKYSDRKPVKPKRRRKAA